MAGRHALEDFVPPLWLSAEDFMSVHGSASKTDTGRTQVWSFPDDATSIIATTIVAPGSWESFDVWLWWANGGSGTGDVTWRGDRRGLGDGSTIVTPATGTLFASTDLTAGAEDELIRSQVVTAQAWTPGQMQVLTVVRSSGGLPNPAYFVAYEIRKAS